MAALGRNVATSSKTGAHQGTSRQDSLNQAVIGRRLPSIGWGWVRCRALAQSWMALSGRCSLWIGWLLSGLHVLPCYVVDWAAIESAADEPPPRGRGTTRSISGERIVRVRANRESDGEDMLGLEAPERPTTVLVVEDDAASRGLL